MKRILVFLPAVALIIPVFFSCTETDVKSIEREDIFSLDIGLMEDQIALYNPGGQGTVKRPGLAMRDGFFLYQRWNKRKSCQL